MKSATYHVKPLRYLRRAMLARCEPDKDGVRTLGSAQRILLNAAKRARSRVAIEQAIAWVEAA